MEGTSTEHKWNINKKYREHTQKVDGPYRKQTEKPIQNIDGT